MLEILTRLIAAIDARNAELVDTLLNDPRASHVPRDVREEALAIVRTPGRGMRAPVRLYVHYHRVVELLAVPRPRNGAQHEIPLELPLLAPQHRGHDVPND